MKTFNFHELLPIDGVVPSEYQVRKLGSGCRNTIEVIAEYRCPTCNDFEKWKFVFSVFDLPSVRGGSEILLSCFSRKRIDTSVKITEINKYDA